MADTPEFKRGPAGDPTAPPAEYGQAQGLNQAAAAIPDQTQAPAQPETTPPEEIPGMARSVPSVPPAPQGTDRQRFLYSPTDRPSEDVMSGVTSGGKLAPPVDLWKWLPDVRDVAMVPDAPAAVREFYDAIAAQLALNGITY